VIDDEDSYEELTVTCMIGYALANALKMNILSNEYMEVLENAWNFVDSRIEDSGIVHDSCTGTGSLSSIEDYLNRKAENGFDNRGGSLSAWFLVDLYTLLNDL